MIGLTPHITAVSVVRHGVLRLVFADGASGDVEVIGRMRGPVFDMARTEEGFRQVAVDFESGTITWPSGADLAPDVLYEHLRTGTWPSPGVAA